MLQTPRMDLLVSYLAVPVVREGMEHLLSQYRT